MYLLLVVQKINLSRTSPANRTRSRPNSVHMDRSREDNVQEILGAIGLFWAKWGAETRRFLRRCAI